MKIYILFNIKCNIQICISLSKIFIYSMNMNWLFFDHMDSIK